MARASKINLLTIVVLCLISRLPQLLSGNLFLDGDECILGLMAKHFLEGQRVPYFFYGQAYGFTLIEMTSIRLFYSIFDITDIAVKISMLSLWTVGIILFYKTLEQISDGKWLPFLVTLVFIFAPSWAIWSMKARGGYLTAFTLTWLVTFLLFNKKYNRSIITLSLIGVIVTVIYQSQPLWLAGLIPIIGYQIYKTRPVRSTIMLCLGVALGVLVFYAVRPTYVPFSIPQALSLPYFHLESVCKIPSQVYENLTGSYLYADYFPPAFYTKLWAFVFTSLIFIALMIAFFYAVKKKAMGSLFYVFCVSVLCTIGYLLFTHGAQIRYLLPITGYALLMFYTLVNHLSKKLLFKILLCFLIAVGSLSLYSFKNSSFERTDKEDLLDLIAELESRNIHYVYCKDGLLQWQIMFYSQELIKARFTSKIDRYPEYIEQVDSALNRTGTKVAMVGFFNQSSSFNSPDMISVNNQYFVLQNPNKDILMDQNFQF